MNTLQDISTSPRNGKMPSPRLRVGLLESFPADANALTDLLEKNGHDVIHESNGDEFLSLVARESFDMLLLDWSPHDLSGYDVLRRVREELHSDVPVLMLTARSGELEVVQALNGGADDYMVKPWRPFELLARIQVLMRAARAQNIVSKEEYIEGWNFNFVHKLVTHDGLSVKLPHKEFEVARLLFGHLGRPLSREQLKHSVWADDVNSRTIDTHISRVRVRLGLTFENGFQLQAIYGFGYRLDRVN